MFSSLRRKFSSSGVSSCDEPKQWLVDLSEVKLFFKPLLSSCPTRHQHFLFITPLSTVLKLRFCLSTGARGSRSCCSPDDLAVCIHLIIVRNLAHSGKPYDQARSSAVCPFLLHTPIWTSLATRRLRQSRLPTFAALWSGVSPKTSCKTRLHIRVSLTFCRSQWAK